MDNDQTTDQEGVTTATVSAAGVAVIRERVAKLHDRIAKKGLDGDVTLTVSDARSVKVSAETDPVDRWEIVHDVTITVAPVALPGDWKLAGTIDFATAAPNVLLNSVNGFTLPEAFRTVSVCDHCDRHLRRNKLIVVADTDGNLVRVGTTCVRDYLGVDPARLIWYMDVTADLLDEPDDGWGGGHVDWGWDTNVVIEAAIVAVRRWGWKPASFEAPTKADVASILTPRSYDDDDVKAARDDLHSGTHAAEAQRIVDWVRSIDPEGNDYLANLVAVLDNDWVRPKGLGLAVSAVSAWDREQGRIAERKAREAADAEVPDAWVGAEGERVTLTGRVTRFSCFENQWGTQAVIVVATTAGWVKVFTGCTTSFADAADEAREAGEPITFTGTVKKHDTYQGRHETVLTRCKAA